VFRARDHTIHCLANMGRIQTNGNSWAQGTPPRRQGIEKRPFFQTVGKVNNLTLARLDFMSHLTCSPIYCIITLTIRNYRRGPFLCPCASARRCITWLAKTDTSAHGIVPIGGHKCVRRLCVECLFESRHVGCGIKQSLRSFGMAFLRTSEREDLYLFDENQNYAP
jgi:hypothetical protein